MSDLEELERALAAVEADEQQLTRELAELTRARAALTATALSDTQAQRDALAGALRTLSDEHETLEAERAALLAKASRRRPRLPPFIRGPSRWAVNVAAFTFYVGCVLHTHRAHHSAGLTLAVVIGLPIAFIALMVAGSLRESSIDERVAHGEGPPGAARGGPGAGEGAAPRVLDAGPAAPVAGGGRATGTPECGSGGAGAAPGRGDPTA